jgi:hypothetical protein
MMRAIFGPQICACTHVCTAGSAGLSLHFHLPQGSKRTVRLLQPDAVDGCMYSWQHPPNTEASTVLQDAPKIKHFSEERTDFELMYIPASEARYRQLGCPQSECGNSIKSSLVKDLCLLTASSDLVACEVGFPAWLFMHGMLFGWVVVPSKVVDRLHESTHEELVIVEQAGCG